MNINKYIKYSASAWKETHKIKLYTHININKAMY